MSLRQGSNSPGSFYASFRVSAKPALAETRFAPVLVRGCLGQRTGAVRPSWAISRAPESTKKAGEEGKSRSGLERDQMGKPLQPVSVVAGLAAHVA